MSPIHLISLTLVAVLMTSLSHAFPSYQQLIPNGDRVRHPCLPFLTWKGVGHKFSVGGGARNDFGQALADASYDWSSALCNADTDGDGKTNGEELGDPDCIWTMGDTPSRTTRITHPGYKPFDIIGCFFPFLRQ